MKHTHSLTLPIEFIDGAGDKGVTQDCLIFFLFFVVVVVSDSWYTDVERGNQVSCNHHFIFSCLQRKDKKKKIFLLNVYTTLCSVVPHELSGFRYGTFLDRRNFVNSVPFSKCDWLSVNKCFMRTCLLVILCLVKLTVSWSPIFNSFFGLSVLCVTPEPKMLIFLHPKSSLLFNSLPLWMQKILKSWQIRVTSV